MLKEPVMTAHHDQGETVRPASEDGHGLVVGRRQWLRGAAGIAPVMMTVVSRPVTAAVCTSGSSFASINASRPDKQFDCAGRSPGYWKQSQHFCDWPGHCVPSSAPVAAKAGRPGYNPPLGAKPTQFDTVFGAFGGYPGKSLLDVLSLMGNAMDRDALARHVVAAFLNAGKGYVPPMVLSSQSVLDIWISFVTNGYYEPTAGIKWYPDSIITWLKTTMPI
jgi:hypothetical protein